MLLVDQAGAEGTPNSQSMLANTRRWIRTT